MKASVLAALASAVLLVAPATAGAGERVVTGPRGGMVTKSVTASDGVVTRSIGRKGAFGASSDASQTCVVGSGTCTRAFTATDRVGRTVSGSGTAIRSADGFSYAGQAVGPRGGVWTRTVKRR